jgi:hypothetical protein
MKRLSSYWLLFTLSVLCYSCKSKDEKKEAAATTQENIKDTLSRLKQEKMADSYAPDVSPMDMSYYPADYPILKMTKGQLPPPMARLIYSRPHLGGRHLFHELLKYGVPWRLGANEATELQLYKDATIQDKKVKAGRYVLYCIPKSDKWAIILNSNIDSWGLVPDSTKDIARFEIPIQTVDRHLEYFTMLFENKDSSAQLMMAWDNVEARLPIHF